MIQKALARVARIVALGCVPLLILVAPATGQTEPEPIVSPRLLKLSAAVQTGDKSAESKFWKEIEGHAPLLDLIPPRNRGDEWVTFVWRGDDSTTAVALNGLLPPRRNQRWFEGLPALSHLPGTQVWYHMEQLPLDFRILYAFEVTHRSGLQSGQVPDPFNTGPQLYGASEAHGDFAPKQPWLTRLSGVRPGTLRRDSLFSVVLGQERGMTVYLPADSARRARASLIVVLDGERYATDLPGPVTLDNLIGKQMIGSAIAVFVDSRTWDRQDDYACNRNFADFIVNELVPYMRTKYGVQAPAARSVIAGSSQGGLQAACTAYWHPNVFGNVLSMSGSFFWYPDWPTIEQGPSTQTAWLTRQFAVTPKRPLRFFLTTGTFEGDGVPENRRMRDVLIAKGYPLKYVEYDGGHDASNWRGYFADGLIALLGAQNLGAQ